VIPCCWPTSVGRCGCGRGHTGKEIGKAALISYRETPPTPERIRRWWQRWPHANRGRLLEAERLLVIDLDSEDAVTEAEALGLPVTPISTSGRGSRRHYWFRRPETAPITNTTKRGTSRAIDVLAAGYVLVPNSVHRYGSVYRWLVPDTEVPFAEAPPWAVAMLNRNSAVQGPTSRGPCVSSGASARERLRNFSDPLRPPSPDVDLQEARLLHPADLQGNIPPQGLHGPTYAQVDDLQRTSVPQVLDMGLAALDLHPRILAVIETGTGPTYPSRSEAVHAVILHLMKRGVDDATIVAILLDPRYGISSKPIQQGRRWLVGELARARRKCGTQAFRTEAVQS
jgi:hypothetical protein